ncbi:MAG: 16S rRNA (cytidine(1402)-2'-O)-methyltransferase [Anaerolineales bacterium]|nr:16S rRNA (cytidine(1402)-2'-O)-methyltransferase [Anaerolineales bacterium]
MGTLFLVATPIGNLEDISQRALRILREVRLIAAEDTRHTRKLLDRYQITTPLLSYHEHNKLVRKDRLLAALEAGDIALVSDAGTPGLSDPGFLLVHVALEAGHTVSPIPGPSAPIAALVASGLPTETFIFLGYLPRKASERRRFLNGLIHEQRTMIAFEVPHRLRAAMDDLVAVLGAERPVAVCRELTKVHEDILRGTLQTARDHFHSVEPRGEFTLVIGGAAADVAWDEASVRVALAKYLEEGLTPSEAAREVAAVSGWSRQEVYKLMTEEP